MEWVGEDLCLPSIGETVVIGVRNPRACTDVVLSWVAQPVAVGVLARRIRQHHVDAVRACRNRGTASKRNDFLAVGNALSVGIRVVGIRRMAGETMSVDRAVDFDAVAETVAVRIDIGTGIARVVADATEDLRQLLGSHHCVVLPTGLVGDGLKQLGIDVLTEADGVDRDVIRFGVFGVRRRV